MAKINSDRKTLTLPTAKMQLLSFGYPHTDFLKCPSPSVFPLLRSTVGHRIGGCEITVKLATQLPVRAAAGWTGKVNRGILSNRL